MDKRLIDNRQEVLDFLLMQLFSVGIVELLMKFVLLHRMVFLYVLPCSPRHMCAQNNMLHLKLSGSDLLNSLRPCNISKNFCVSSCALQMKHSERKSGRKKDQYIFTQTLSNHKTWKNVNSWSVSPTVVFDLVHHAVPCRFQNSLQFHSITHVFLQLQPVFQYW